MFAFGASDSADETNSSIVSYALALQFFLINFYRKVLFAAIRSFENRNEPRLLQEGPSVSCFDRSSKVALADDDSSGHRRKLPASSRRPKFRSSATSRPLLLKNPTSGLPPCIKAPDAGGQRSVMPRFRKRQRAARESPVLSLFRRKIQINILKQRSLFQE